MDDAAVVSESASPVELKELQTELDTTLKQVDVWYARSQIILHIKKPVFSVAFSRPIARLDDSYGNSPLTKLNETTFLGVVCKSTLSFTSHIDALCTRMKKLPTYFSA